MKANFRLNKKGLSTIISTVSIILLTVVAVAMISSFIFKMINDMLSGTECSKYRDYFTFEKENGYNCYNNESGNFLYGITVRKKTLGAEADAKIEGFGLAFKSSGEGKGVLIKQGQNVTRGNEGIRMLNSSLGDLILPDGGGYRTYVYNTTKEIKSVEVYALISGERQCEMSDSISVDKVKCDDTLSLN